MQKEKVTIAITGLNNTDNPELGIPFIRGIKESNEFEYRIIGLIYENMEPAIYLADLLDAVYKIPYPSAGIEVVLDRIKYINDKEKIQVLIPNFDAELITFIKTEKQLSEIGINTFLPNIEQFEERHKTNLPEFGKKYEIKVPYSKSIAAELDIKKLRDEFEFPVLVKGKFYDAYIAYNEEQVTTFYNKIVAKWGLPIVVQEYISGTEVNVVALGDGLGNTTGAVPMRKLFVNDKGKAWSGITLNDEKILEITQNLIRKTKWKGGIELEMIKTIENEYFLIEINPRIPTWVYLAVGAGQNIPEALIKLALGKKVVPLNKYTIGKIFIRYSYDLIVDNSVFEQLSNTGEIVLT